MYICLDFVCEKKASKMKDIVQTPLMRQYYMFKKQHPDAILLFRVGDFYETFDEDARISSKVLGITLTKRANGKASYVDLAGFPYHALDTYLPKLVRAGYRVAIVEQLEDPKKAKKIVKRGLTELVTPGVSLNDNILENKEYNFLAAVVFGKKLAGIAFLDISTGDFYATEGEVEYVDKLINSFRPKEVLYERGMEQFFEQNITGDYYTYPVEDWMMNYESAYERLVKQFGTTSLKGFGLENMELATRAAGAILHYLDTTQHTELAHIQGIRRIEREEFVWIDKFTYRNLEIFSPLHEKGKALVDILDKTKTMMGSRRLRQWLAFPLKDVEAIAERLDAVEFFVSFPSVREAVETELEQIADLERFVSKIATKRINPRQVVQLKQSLEAIGRIREILQDSAEHDLRLIDKFISQLKPLNDLIERIDREIVDDPPVQVSKGGVIKEGVDETLDELRKISSSGQTYLAELQARLSKITKIPSLKIGYNKVFGYYIEVTNTHKHRVPSDWIRKQTLVNSERYITPELKEYEEKILSAEEKILELESLLYDRLLDGLQSYLADLRMNARLVSELDVLVSFANVAIQNNYVKPDVNKSYVIDIRDGRHPVIETQLPLGEDYIPNDVHLDPEKQQILIITGPNMAGKSAYLRQNALIVLMAQVGSFVPASEAHIGYVDKIFTRVGASDNIALGESTFMVEMNEAALILNNLSNRSLVIFDELGRGTSTYDGISIAWAIVEYIHEHPRYRAKTLFATHYHELNEMEKSYSRIKNYNVAVREADGKIIFLRKVVPGGSEHSFGIHVAEMAGLPKSVIRRARQILAELEGKGKDGRKKLSKPVQEIGSHRQGYQLRLFELADPVLAKLRDKINSVDINTLTPLDALNLLNEIKKEINQ